MPDTTSVVPSQSGLQTTQIVESKRTGEGNWDEEIEDEVYFQYPDEEQTSINNNDAPWKNYLLSLDLLMKYIDSTKRSTSLIIIYASIN